MKTHSGSWLWLGCLGLAFLALPAAAAPYCVEVQGMQSQCLHVDGAECRQRAQQLGGSCAANPAELSLPAPGQFPYCIVGAGYSACKFADRGSCEAEASRQRASCVESYAAGAQSAAPDPYRDLFVPGR